jgi:microcystin-dependent protein
VSEPYIAQVMIFSFNFAPVNYAFCNGALISIAQNEALFSLVGTTYGGNGTTNFALPNIQDAGVVNIGQGPGLSNYDLGQKAGVTDVTLNIGQIPGHTHQAYGTAGSSQDAGPAMNGWFGNEGRTGKLFDPPAQIDQAFNPAALSVSGGSQPHENEQPFLGMNYCIALYGIYPSRN